MARKRRKSQETDFVYATINYLKMRGAMAWRNNKGMARMGSKEDPRFVHFGGDPGASDVFALVPPNGTFLAVECKLPGQKPTDDQLEFIEKVRSVGGWATWIEYLEDLYEYLLEKEHALREVHIV